MHTCTYTHVLTYIVGRQIDIVRRITTEVVTKPKSFIYICTLYVV